MTTKPLGYEAQKIVLQYLEPHSRIQLSRKCRSIRITEKLVPLRIDHLTFGEMRTEINGTRYHLGVYRHYPPNAPIPEHHLYDNTSDGAKIDLDKFDVEDQSASTTVTPGDVDLWKQPRRWPSAQELQRRHEYFETELRKEEQELKTLLSNSPEDKIRITVLELHIAHLYQHLESYFWKKDNVSPPFTHFLQLTIRSNRGITVERYQYSKKLSEGLKYLNTLLFGGRRLEVQVKRLTLMDTFSIYRFPIGFKLRVRTLESEFVEYEKLNTIIQPSHYPTINLMIQTIYNPDDVYDQIAINQAKSLFIFYEHHHAGPSIFETLRGLQTKQVTLLTEVPMSDYTHLATNWLDNGRPIGSTYTFGLREEKSAKDCMKFVKSQHRERLRRDQGRSMTFAMPNGSSQLRIYYERILPEPERYDAWGREYSLWHLIFRVEAI